MKRTYIVTGANGHLGGTILRLLRQEDCTVRGLLLPGEKPAVPAGERLSYYTGDVRRPDSLQALFAGAEGGGTVVLHTAGIISINDKETPGDRRPPQALPAPWRGLCGDALF